MDQRLWQNSIGLAAQRKSKLAASPCLPSPPLFISKVKAMILDECSINTAYRDAYREVCTFMCMSMLTEGERKKGTDRLTVQDVQAWITCVCANRAP